MRSNFLRMDERLHIKAHDFNRGGVNIFGVIIWNVMAIGLTPNPSPEERGIPLSQCHENILEVFHFGKCGIFETTELPPAV